MVSTFNAKDCLAKIASEKITLTILVPAMYNLFLIEPSLREFDFSAWRIGASGGALMPAATLQAMAAALPGLTLVNSYGATETTSPTSIIPLGEQADHLDSVGRIVPCGGSGWSTKTNAKCRSENLAKSGSPAQWSFLAIGATTRPI